MSDTLNNIEKQIPQKIAVSKTYSIPDRGDGISAVFEAKTKKEANEKAQKLLKKFSNKTI